MIEGRKAFNKAMREYRDKHYQGVDLELLFLCAANFFRREGGKINLDISENTLYYEE